MNLKLMALWQITFKAVIAKVFAQRQEQKLFFHQSKFFTPALADGFSLKFE